MRTSVYIATSLDGFIARTDGNLDWLDQANATVPEGEDFGFSAFMDSVDALIMGRKTFDQVMTFGQWPYGEKPVIVLSRNPLEIPAQLTSQVRVSAESPADLHAHCQSAGYQRVYVDGGLTIRRFLQAGLVTDLTLTVIPDLLGSGIRIFTEDAQDISLVLQSSHAAENGFVQLKYLTQKHVEDGQ